MPATITVVENRVIIDVGENTTLVSALAAQVQDDVATVQSVKDQTEAARDIAIATADFPTLTAAQAAFPGTLSEGQTFSYLDATNLMMRGKIVSGVATALSGPYLSATKIGLSNGNTVEEAIDAIEANASDSTFYTSAFPSLAAAMDALISNGGTLVFNSDINVPAPIIRYPVDGKSYKFISDRRRRLLYTGTATGDAMIRMVIGAGVTAPIEWDASLEFDADRKAAVCLATLSDAAGDDRANFIMRGDMVFRNARSLVGSGYEANGFIANGGYKDIDVRDFEIYDISAPVGATIPGSRGARGFQIFGVLGTTRSAERIFVGRHKVVNVVNDETPGTTNYTEMDSIIFQSAEGAKQAPVVENGYHENVPGRAIKIFAPFGGGSVRNIRDVLTIPPVSGGGGGSPRINLQHGTGTVEKCGFSWSAGAVGSSMTAVSFANTAYALRSKPIRVADITIDDASGTTHPCVVDLRRSATSSVTPVAAIIENIQSNGLHEALFLPGGLGSTLAARVDLKQINVRLTQALIKTDDSQPFLRVILSDVDNTSGTTVPARRLLSNAMAVAGWGDFVALTPCSGLTVYYGAWRGVPGWSNGVRGAGVGGVEAAPLPGTSETSGRCALPAMTIPAGGSVTIGPFGQHNPSGGDYAINARVVDGNSGGTGFVSAHTGANSQSFTPIVAPTTAAIVLTNGGTPVGTANTVEIVKNANMTLTIHNFYAVARTVQPTANP